MNCNLNMAWTIAAFLRIRIIEEVAKMLSEFFMEEVFHFYFLKILDFNQRENDSLMLWVRCDAFQNKKVSGFPSCYTYILKRATEMQ